jgi:adenosylmethionine-8-amino-7-oxononanoate aminotransferase
MRKNKAEKVEVECLIEFERERAVDDLRQLENTAHRIVGNGQQILAHPVAIFDEILKPREHLLSHIWTFVGAAVVGGIAVGILTSRRPERLVTSASHHSRGISENLRRMLSKEIHSVIETAASGFFGKVRGAIERETKQRSWSPAHSWQDEADVERST